MRAAVIRSATELLFAQDVTENNELIRTEIVTKSLFTLYLPHTPKLGLPQIDEVDARCVKPTPAI